MERRNPKRHMIEVYKVMWGVDKVNREPNRELLFTRSQNTRSRGHALILTGDNLKANEEVCVVCIYVCVRAYVFNGEWLLCETDCHRRL